LQNALQW